MSDEFPYDCRECGAPIRWPGCCAACVHYREMMDPEGDER